MISKERVRHMTKLAEFENEESKSCQKATQYFRRDYVALELIKSFFAGTIAFGLLFVVWLFYDMENLAKKINNIDLVGVGIQVVVGYLVFLAAYLIITYIMGNRRYTKGRKQVKEYYNRLKRVSSLYREEENISNTDDWEV